MAIFHNYKQFTVNMCMNHYYIVVLTKLKNILKNSWLQLNLHTCSLNSSCYNCEFYLFLFRNIWLHFLSANDVLYWIDEPQFGSFIPRYGVLVTFLCYIAKQILKIELKCLFEMFLCMSANPVNYSWPIQDWRGVSSQLIAKTLFSASQLVTGSVDSTDKRPKQL